MFQAKAFLSDKGHLLKTLELVFHRKTVLIFKLFSQAQKNVSEPQTGIEPATF